MLLKCSILPMFTEEEQEKLLRIITPRTSNGEQSERMSISTSFLLGLSHPIMH